MADRPGLSFNRGLILGAFAAQLFAILVYARFRPQVFASIEMLAIVPGLAAIAALVWWRPRAWTYLAAAVGALVLPILLLVIVTHGRIVLDPLIPNDFISKVLLLLAAALAVPAGVSGWRRARAGLPSLSLQERARTPMGLAMIAVVGVAAGAVGSGLLASAHAPTNAALVFDIPHAASVNAAARYFAFDPEEILIQSGVATELRVVNADVALHTLSYAWNGTEYQHELPAGATTSFVLLLSGSERVPFWCDLHTNKARTTGMVGAFVMTIHSPG